MKFYSSFLMIVFVLLPTLSQTQTISISDAVELGLKQNRDLKILEHEIEIGKSKVLQAGAIPNLTLQTTWNEIPDYINFPGAAEFEIGLTQEFEFPGKRSSKINLSESSLTESELMFQLRKKQISAKIKQLYFDALLARKEIENIGNQIHSLKSVHSALIIGFQSGTVLMTQIQQIKSEMISAENEKNDLEVKEKSIMAELKFFLAAEQESDLMLSDSLTSEIHPQTSVTPESSFSLKILQQNKSKLNLVRQSVSLSKLPDFSVGAAFQRRENFTGVKDNYGGISFGVSIPSLFTNETEGRILEADQSILQADLLIGKAKSKISIQINTAQNKLVASKTKMENYRQLSTDGNLDLLSSAMNYFTAGKMNFSELLMAFRTAKQIQEEYVRSIYDYQIALTEMEISNEIAD